ncbi:MULTISPECIES: D-alanine--D-alanine ligase family protein [unclassified Corynebacterium]|uniref:D-alanine--D-alanine ligase family protein n=1 Tax=Corynebacterium TaxID=1716 RepID=UPI00254AF89E|nr:MULTISPECIES: D-alanine--D-alanine ligase family protein [unclassified Corynebacterium]MDK8452883.1 D-alanine--D-alanine ligase family protein [Corynebacterium sp. MSK084]MDK8467266.1 D-alanine--D-alanine ligase family protein [Corynebacterium sp. MSK130]MDK8476550.1 D-alanine--D-alanine ligase family protein [Corynebacterium sp. MSK310]MDK8514761.1 D-alanine--D-alanine ligase family protein [Corynebacterium sp. MSK123]MDK8548039.1 D-alanine--D-alanine ligase family protein [Corynebacterium
MTEKTRVAVLYGGRSTEHSVSCVSAGAIMKHLDPEKFEVVPIGITREGTWTPGDTEGLEIVDGVMPEVKRGTELALSADPSRKGEIRTISNGSLYAQVDVIFPILHGPYGEDGTMQGLFELSGIPYVGPGVLASSVGMDKEFTKKILSAAGLPVAPEVIVQGRTELTAEEKDSLGLPVFVKPARGGSSIGVSKVSDWAEFPEAVRIALEDDDKILVEPEIVGREVEVGVLQYPDGELIASVPALLKGIDDSDEGFYGFETKYLDNVVTAQIPAPFPEELTAQLREMAIRAFRALNCAGLSRVDFFVTEEGLYINEVNTLPGFTPISMYPQVLAASGVDYPTLLEVLIARAQVRTA